MFPTPRSSFRPAALLLGFGADANLVSQQNRQINIPGGNLFSVDLEVNQVGSFRVVNGIGGTVSCGDAFVGEVFDPAEPRTHGGQMRVIRDPHTFNVRGVHQGTSLINVTSKSTTGLGFGDFITLVVQGPPDSITFTEGDHHDHKPSGRWAEVQANPRNYGKEDGQWIDDVTLTGLCKTMTPRQLVTATIFLEFGDKPLALQHLNWYLKNGQGRDFKEDDNIKRLLLHDQGVRRILRNSIPGLETKKSGTFADHTRIEQFNYAIQDFRFAFGAIDRLDFEVDFGARTLHVWFLDRYEWHPVYAGLYQKKDGELPRPTNCLHAALVELQSEGAADFWMRGESTMPLELILTG